MRVVVQRVSRASVTVGREIVGSIGPGLVALVGVAPDDGEVDAVALADKLVGLRIFADDEGLMNRSVQDVEGSVLIVSQFTLYGDVRKGRRPSFTGAAAPSHASGLIDHLATVLEARGVTVATGSFGAAMEVDLVNDGPVTLVFDVTGGRVR